ncbi:MAG: carbohydrate ABC transporter permease, partial [bacterium]
MRSNTGRRTSTVLVYGFLLGYLTFVLFPLLWLLLSSFKTRQDALALPPRIAFSPTWDAWEKVFTAGVMQPFGNSFLIAATNIIIALALAIPGAYVLARMQGGAKNHLSFWVLSTRMAPAFGVV